MKRVKKGFTLAEVLITLAIIGVVAALTIPTLMADSRYQLISSRIAKFRSVTEDAALAYAAMNEKIEKNDLANIILYKEKDGDTYYLKDDTTVTLYEKGDQGMPKGDHGIPNSYKVANDDVAEKYGGSAVLLVFSPNVSGLSTVRQTYWFVMTDKGYVIPDRADDCLAALFSNDYKGKMNAALGDGACKSTTNHI